MKKLSLLISLVLCMTIGGVYATWYYTDANQAINHSVTLGVGIHATTSGEVGTFSIVIEDGVQTVFYVDQYDTDNYTAKLTAPKKITLVFTPKANSTEDVLANGVDAYWYFNNASALESVVYDKDGDGAGLPEQIFTYVQADGASNAVKIGKANSAEANKFTYDSGTNTFRYEMTEDLLNAIQLMDVELPTYDDFTAFSTALGSSFVFGISISSVDPAPAP